jgi:hypothetical protein
MATHPDHNAAVEEWRRLAASDFAAISPPDPSTSTSTPAAAGASFIGGLIAAILAAFRRPPA